MSFIYEERLVTLQDGTQAREARIHYFTSRSASISVSGSYSVFEESGTVESVSYTEPATDPTPTPTNPDATFGRLVVTHGGNGTRLSASAEFSFSGSVAMTTSIDVSSTFADGAAEDDIDITGSAMSTITASVGGSVVQDLSFDSQSSSGSPSGDTDEHEYLAIRFHNSGTGSASMDFHLGFDIDSSASDEETTDEPTGGGDDISSGDDPTMTEDPTLAAASSAADGTGTDSGTTSAELVDDPYGETGDTGGGDDGTGGDEGDIDLGFGVSMANLGEGTSTIVYSKKERFVPSGGGEGIRSVGYGLGASSGGSSSFSFEIVDGTPVFSMSVSESTNRGESYGSSVWSRQNLNAPDNIPAGMTATSDITGEIAVAEASIFTQTFTFSISFGVDGLDVGGDMETSARYILSDVSWYDLRETVFDSFGAITFESHSLMRNINETVAVTTANLTDGAKSHSYTASGFWADVRIDGVDPFIQAEPEKTFEDYANIGLDVVQVGLDVVGLIPAVGEVADLANAAISVARGNYGDAALSLAAMVPFLGWEATAGKYAAKVGKEVVQHTDEAALAALRYSDDGFNMLSKNASDAADTALAGGKTRGAAAQLNIDGKMFTDVSGPKANIDQRLKDALESIPPDKRSPWHGACAEVGCIDQALKSGIDDLSGGTSIAVNIGQSGLGHGTFKEACSSCRRLLDYFRIKH